MEVFVCSILRSIIKLKIINQSERLISLGGASLPSSRPLMIVFI